MEACKESGESEVRQRRKHPDITERTSDNYGHNENANGKRPSINKRKASNIDAADAELNWVLSKDNLADMTVTVIEKEVLIEMLCPWRECLLLEIVDAISNLHLDAHSVQSSTTDGILTLKLRSKVRCPKKAICSSCSIILLLVCKLRRINQVSISNESD